MTLLTVDVGGANATLIPFARAGNAERRSVGARRYAFAGNERSMIQAEGIVVPVQLAALPAATVATIRTLFAEGAAVDCEGDVFNNGNATVVCTGEITDEMEVGGTYWNLSLTLTEVSARSSGVFGLYAAAGGVGSAAATLVGRRYLTSSAAGSATTAVASPTFVRTLTVAAGGSATTSARTTTQQRTVAAAGVGTVTITGLGPRPCTSSAAGRATTAVTGTKIP